MSFANDLEKFAKKTNLNLDAVVVNTFFKLNSLVIKRTPVDEGYARGGWIASLNFPSSSPNVSDKTGSDTLNKANKVTENMVGKVWYLVNSVIYIRVLEYGGYPNPPLLGTWNPKTKEYEIRSIGGFSKLAPAGMVRISIIEIKKEIAKQVRRVQ